MTKRLRRCIAKWLMPELFRGAHDLCNSIMPLNCKEKYDNYHIHIINEQDYITAWTQVMGIVYDCSDEWEVKQ